MGIKPKELQNSENQDMTCLPLQISERGGGEQKENENKQNQQTT